MASKYWKCIMFWNCACEIYIFMKNTAALAYGVYISQLNDIPELRFQPWFQSCPSWHRCNWTKIASFEAEIIPSIMFRTPLRLGWPLWNNYLQLCFNCCNHNPSLVFLEFAVSNLSYHRVVNKNQDDWWYIYGGGSA